MNTTPITTKPQFSYTADQIATFGPWELWHIIEENKWQDRLPQELNGPVWFDYPVHLLRPLVQAMLEAHTQEIK